MASRIASALVLLLSWVLREGTPDIRPHATFTVNSIGVAGDASPGDGVCDTGTGSCTIRAAVEEANAFAGADTITFAIGSGPQTITIGPIAITEQVTIDGTTQPGYTGTPLIRLDGAASTGDGLQVNADSCLIRGLIITQYTGNGIAISGDGNTVEQCYVGTDGTSNNALGNTMDGIAVLGGSNNVLQNNVIAFNDGDGVAVYDNANSGYPLFTALTADQTLIVPSVSFQDNCQLFQHTAGSTIFDTLGRPFAENFGMRLTATMSISTPGTYTFTFVNLDDNGRLVIDSNEEMNVNGGDADLDADVVLSAGDHSIEVDYQEGGGAATLHFTASGPSAPTFNFSGSPGWQAELFQFRVPAEGNRISENSTFDNGGGGIGLSCCCRDTNDAGDADVGPNTFLNYPVFTGVTNNLNGTITVQGTAPANAVVEVFGSSNDSTPPFNGYGEGKLYLTTVNADGGGNFGATFTLPQPYYSVTATATDASNNTSEFAQNFVVRARNITVTNTNDIGSGSLRDAINEANGDGVESSITFDPLLSGGSIAINSPLPALIEDGTSIQGDLNGDCQPDIEVRGNGPVTVGVIVESAYNVVNGLVLNRFTNEQLAVQTADAQNNHVICSFFGFGLNGTATYGMGTYGVVVRNGANNNSVGRPSAGNRIGGVSMAGVRVENTLGTEMHANTIGLGASGATATAFNGIELSNADSAIVRSNRVVGTNAGIRLENGSDFAAIQGNTIGWPAAMTPTGHGVTVNNCTAADITGNTPAGPNVLTNNGGAGVSITNSNGIAVRGNSIYDNGGLGIDLDGDGVTPNDGNGDPDNGANGLQNFPVLTNVTTTTVEGFFDSSGGAYTLELYVNDAPDPSGYGEGKTRVLATGLTPGAFNVAVPAMPVGSWVTALAIASGNGSTSEFSLARQVSGPPLAVTELVAYPALPSGITLRWRDPNAGETGFRVERQSGPGWPTMASVGPDVTTWTDTSVPPNFTHTYRVFATSGAGDAPPSNLAMATSYAQSTPQFCREAVSRSNEHATAPSVAHDGTNWAMAWSDQDGGRAGDIFFQLLNADGTPNGAPLQITADDVPSTNPTLTWNGTNYGLVWFDHLRRPDGSPVSQISFALLGPSGAKVRGDVRIASNFNAGVLPADGSVPLLWNGTGWAVFVTEQRNTQSNAVLYRLDADGDLIGSSIIGGLAPRMSNISAAWNGTEYAIALVHEQSSTNHDMRFRRVLADGSTPFPSISLGFGPSPDGAGTSIIQDGTGWAVAFSARQFNGDTAVFLARIDSAGNQIGASVRLSDSSPVYDTRPKLVAMSGGGYRVYTESVVTGVRRLARLEADSAGQKVGTLTVINGPNEPRNPRVAVAGTDHLLAWNDFPTEVGDVVVTEAGVAGTVNLVTSGHTPPQASQWPVVLPFEGSFVTLWNEAFGSSNRIFARIYRANGSTNNFYPLHVTGTPAGRFGAVAQGGSFAVAWTDRVDGKVHYDRYGSNGLSQMMGGDDYEISPTADVDLGASIGWSGEYWGVAWVYQGQVRFRRMGHNTPIGVVTTIPSTAQSTPQIQWVGSGWALMWHNGNGLQYARLDPFGALVVPPVLITDGGFPIYDFQMVFTGQHLGVMWEQGSGPTGTDIRFTTLDENGFRNFTPVNAVNTASEDRDGALFFDGTNFHVVYPDTVAGIRDVQVSPAGTVVSSQFRGHHGEGRIAAATVGATHGFAWEHRGDIYFQTTNCFNDASAPPCPTLNGSFNNGIIDLSWNNVSDPQSGIQAFHLYRDASLLTELVPASLTYADGGFTPAATHVYELRAVNGASLESTGCTTKSIVAGIAVLPTTLPNARQGTNYFQTFSTQGATGSVTFNVSNGALPGGMSLTGPSNVNLTGAPNVSGLFQFDITATDSLAATGTRTYMLRVCPANFVYPIVLPDPTLGTAYSQTLSVNGSALTHTYSITAGALPNGLSLSAGGTLSGTPTALGSFTFTVLAVASNSCANSQSYTLTVGTAKEPREVRAEGQSVSSMLVTWVRPLKGETGFRIERSTDGGNTWGSINIVGSDVTSHLDSGLAGQTVYHYRVVALYGAETATSAMAAGITFPQGPTPICLQTIGPYHARAQFTAVAHNGTQWAIAWNERSGGQLEDIRFQLLDNATGAPVGSPVTVTQTPMLTRFPNLRWNGTHFGVLFNEQMRGPNGEVTSSTNFALLDGSGNLVRRGVRISNSIGGFIPSTLELPLVWDGAGWGTFSTDVAAVNTPTELYYRRLTPAGDVSTGPVKLTNTAAFETDVHAVWNGSEYGIAWIEQLNGVYKLMFARMNTAGTLAAPPGQLDSAPFGERLGVPNVLWNAAANEWALAWVHYQGSESFVRFRLLNPDGSPKTSTVRLSDDVVNPNDPPIDDIPVIGKQAGGGYLVFTASIGSVFTGLYDVARLQADAAGNRTGARVFLTPSDDDATDTVRVATDGTRFLIGHDLDGPSQIEAATLITDGTGTLTNGPTTITTGHAGGGSGPLAIVAMGADFGAIWMEASGAGNALSAKLYDGGGSLTSSTTNLVSSTSVANRYAVTQAGRNFAVAWRDNSAGLLRFARFNNTGGPQGPQLDVGNGSAPGLAWNGEHYGLAFFEGSQLRFQRIDKNSALAGPKVFVGTGGQQISPQVQWVDRGWSIVWRNNTALFFALLDRNGAFLVYPQQVTFSGAVPSQVFTAWNGERLGLVWRESRSGNPPGEDVWFTALTLEGAKAFPEVTLVSTVNTDNVSGIYWDQDRFRVVYQDGTAGTREVAVQADGTIVPGSRQWHNRGGAMAIAFNGVTLGMLFTSLFDTTIQTSACFSDGTPPICPNFSLNWDGTKITVSWPVVNDPQSGTFGYNVYRDGAMLAEIPTSAVTSFDDFGFVSGTSHVYEVRAVNRAGLESTGCITKSIVAGVSVNPATLANSNVGATYSQAVSGIGGTAPYTFAVTTGSLPPGLGLNTNSGAITGTPSQAGSFPFTITATDSLAQSGSRAYTVRICTGTFTIYPTVLTAGYLSTAYSQTIAATGASGAYALAITSGALPAGLTLDATGWIHGTPTATGVSTFTITATDSLGCTTSRSYTIDIQTGSAVRNLSAFTLGPTSIRLRWTDPARNETAFRIDRSTDFGANWSALTNVGPDTTTFTDTLLTAATAYSYRVVATSPSGSAPASNVATAATWPSTAAKTCLQQISPYHSFARQPFVVRAGSQWAMVYQDRTGGLNDEIWFSLLDATGAMTGSPVRVSQADGVSLRPTIRWNGSKYGVMWIESIRGPAGELPSPYRFALLSSTGAVLRTDVRIPTAETNNAIGLEHQLVWDGSGWGFFEAHLTNDGLHDIFFYRLDEDGDVVAGPTRVTSHADFDLSPSVVWNGTEYGMAWTRARDQNVSVLFQRVSSAGALVGSPTTVSASTIQGIDTIDLAADGSGWAVAWSESVDGQENAVYLRRLNATGTPLGAATRLSDDYDSNNPTPQQPVSDSLSDLFVLSGGGYAATTRSFSPGRTEVGFVRGDAAGNRLGSRVIVSTNDAFASGNPRAATDGTNFLVAFNEGKLGTQELGDVIVNATGGTVSGPTDLTSGHSPGNSANIATSGQQAVVPLGGGFAAIWNEPVAGDTRVYAKIFDAAGALSVTKSPLTTTGVRGRPGIVSVGDTFAVAFRNASNAIVFRRYDAAGDPLFAEVTPVTGAGSPPAIVIGFDGETYGLFWVQGGRVNFQRVSPAGVALGARSTLAEPVSNANLLQALWTGSGWAVVFASSNDIYYALLDAAGASIVAPIRVSFTGDQNKENLAIAWNGEAVGIAYGNRLLTDPPGLVIRFTVVGLDGIKQFTESTVSEGVFDTSLLALYWAGDRFRIAYNSPLSSTLREIDVSTTGTLMGASRLLSPRAGNTALAWNGATTALVWTQTSELWLETTACLADVTAPPCPTVTATRDASGVDLSWPAVTDAESTVYRYFIYRDGSLLHETGATSFEDVGVRPGDQHTYKVTASNGAFLESPGCSTFTLIGVPSALAASYTGSQVQLTWQAAAGATSYRIERSASGNSFAQVGTSPTPGYTDGTAATQTAYLYRVFAVSGPQTSGPTNSDLVTTMTFTDDPLVLGGPVKALHHTQLRQAVAAVRTLAQLGSATYSFTPASGAAVPAADINDLRTALTQALTALSLPIPAYTDAIAAGVATKRIHVQELRDAVK